MLEFKVRLGLRIREIRMEKGWSQQELADAAKMSIGTVQSYEQGIREPLAHVLQTLATALDCTTDDLFKPPALIDAPPRGRPGVTSARKLPAKRRRPS